MGDLYALKKEERTVYGEKKIRRKWVILDTEETEVY